MNYFSKSEPKNVEFSTEDSDDIFLSKSAAKRDADKLKMLAEELVNLSKNSLAQLSLNEDLKSAVELAQTIQKEAKRRQLQYIGKYLRTIDTTPIIDRLNKIKNKNNCHLVQIKKIHNWQDKLLNGDHAVIEDFINTYPRADRQQLRTLIRNIKKQSENPTQSSAYRALQNYLKDLCDTA